METRLTEHGEAIEITACPVCKGDPLVYTDGKITDRCPHCLLGHDGLPTGYVQATPKPDRATIKPEVIGWCPEHGTYQPLTDRWCGFTDHERTNGNLRRRRMYICRESESVLGGRGFFNRQSFLGHDHDECGY